MSVPDLDCFSQSLIRVHAQFRGSGPTRIWYFLEGLIRNRVNSTGIRNPDSEEFNAVHRNVLNNVGKQ